MLDYKKLLDKKLVALCIDNDPVAWLEFVRRFKKLTSFAIDERLRRWNYIYQPSDVEDIRQDVFLSIWEKSLLKTLKDPAKIVPWLAIISANKAIDYFRKKSQKVPHVSILFDNDKTLELADRHNPSPLEEIIFKDSLKSIIDIVKRLSAGEKNILRLSLLYGKTISEIARLFNMPASSVYSVVKRAKNKIRINLKKIARND